MYTIIGAGHCSDPSARAVTTGARLKQTNSIEFGKKWASERADGRNCCANKINHISSLLGIYSMAEKQTLK